MPKCVDCRTKEAMFSKWEKIRSWFAWHLFPIDLKDERTNVYAAGFGDGYKQGFARCKELESQTLDYYKNLVIELQSVPSSLPELDKRYILLLETKNNKKVLTLGGEQIPENLLSELKEEAITFKKMKLHSLFQETLKGQAYGIMFEKSKDFDDMKTGKMMLYNLGVQENIIELLHKIGD